MSYDGCFIDAPLVLTKEEYSAKVLFDKRLLQSIQYSPESKDIFIKLDLPYVELNNHATAFDFGDLLTHMPIFERLKWAEFYRGITTTDIQIAIANKLLFFDFENSEEVDLVQRYWQTRLDNNTR